MDIPLSMPPAVPSVTPKPVFHFGEEVLKGADMEYAADVEFVVIGKVVGLNTVQSGDGKKVTYDIEVEQVIHKKKSLHPSIYRRKND